MNIEQKRALKAATVGAFLQQYGRKARPNFDPNDRAYDRDIEKSLKRLAPEQLDRLMREDVDWRAASEPAGRMVGVGTLCCSGVARCGSLQFVPVWRSKAITLGASQRKHCCKKLEVGCNRH